jgi:hypothetical protein
MGTPVVRPVRKAKDLNSEIARLSKGAPAPADTFIEE